MSKNQSLQQLAKITGLSIEVLKEMQSKEAANKKALPKGIKGAADTASMPVVATVGDYEGKPTISLQRGEASFINRPFTFGKAKAQMIVAQYEAIKAFAESK